MVSKEILKTVLAPAVFINKAEPMCVFQQICQINVFLANENGNL